MPPLPRVLEPEVMDTSEEASDYDAMDHRAVNEQFCSDLLETASVAPGRRVLDAGTGTALIAIELCRRAPGVHVVAIDLAEHMLARAEQNVARAGLREAIVLERADAKALPYQDQSFDVTMSNSLVHHLADPHVALAEMRRVTAPGGLVFVRDLVRPETETEVDELVARYAGVEPSRTEDGARFERQRALFRASLMAALTVHELAAASDAAGMSPATIARTSDRHVTLVYRKP